MKKIALYILVSLVINYAFGITLAFADTTDPSSGTHTLIAAGRTYQAPLIDKPNTLPGPTDEDQKAINDKNRNTSSTQRILTEILLPKATTGFIGFVSMISFLMLIVSGVRFVVAY